MLSLIVLFLDSEAELEGTKSGQAGHPGAGSFHTACSMDCGGRPGRLLPRILQIPLGHTSLEPQQRVTWLARKAVLLIMGCAHPVVHLSLGVLGRTGMWGPHVGLHIQVLCRPAEAQVRVVWRPQRIEIPLATTKRKKEHQAENA